MFPSISRWFRTPSAKEIALQELQTAERDILHAQSQAEYATSMVTYHHKRILRLKEYLGMDKPYAVPANWAKNTVLYSAEDSAFQS